MPFVPAQRFDEELLDAHPTDLPLLAANLRDMGLAHRWLGGERSLRRQIAHWLPLFPLGYRPTVLDVATGGADGALALHRWQPRLRLIASDVDAAILALARRRVAEQPIALLCHDALALPFADRSVDIVTCAQSLHHFGAAVQVLRELARVARVGVVVSDLRRSWGGYWGAQLLAFCTPNPLSRHDGPLSMLRAYTRHEAQHLLAQAKLDGHVRHEPLFRLSLVIQQRL